jgi:hypothetical protein
MSNHVVARYQDGRVVKGTSLDVDPGRPTCHVRPPAGAVAEVKLLDLKALFFVRTLDGDPTHEEARQTDPTDSRVLGSTAITLRFRDGEHLLGFTNHYPPNRPYFFVVPADLNSNNLRILVNHRAVASIEPIGGS